MKRVVLIAALIPACLAVSIPARTDTPGIQLIKHAEGYMPCKYRDSVGVETIGYGHTKTVRNLPECIDSRTAERLLRDDLRDAEWCIQRYTKVDISQNQFDAISSFTFNLGCGNYSRSSLKNRLNAKDYNGASEEFPKWNKAGGKPLLGLTIRRKAEQFLYNL